MRSDVRKRFLTINARAPRPPCPERASQTSYILCELNEKPIFKSTIQFWELRVKQYNIRSKMNACVLLAYQLTVCVHIRSVCEPNLASLAYVGGSSAVLDQAPAAYPLDAALPPLGVQLLLGHGIFEEHAERARLVQGGVVQGGVVNCGVGWWGGGDMQ